MSLETGAFIADLVETNPVGATDFVSQGDDHIRLLKVCIKGSLPNLGSAAMTCDAAELNKLDGLLTTKVELGYVQGVTSAIQTQINTKASSSSVTADIAAAVATLQPLDADLTAIAALATSTYGRGFLTLADDAATATKLAAMVPTWTAVHTYQQAGAGGGTAWIAKAGSTSDRTYCYPANSAGSRRLEFVAIGSASSAIYGAAADTACINGINGWSLCANDALALGISSAGLITINDAGTMREAGFRHAPIVSVSSPTTMTAANNGKMMVVTGTGTVTGYAAADGVIMTFIVGVATTFTAGSGNLYWAGGGGSFPTGVRNVAVGSTVTMLRHGGDWYFWGNGIS